MTWTTDYSDACAIHSLETLKHQLESHYPLLGDAAGTLDTWILLALKDDEATLGLMVPPMATEEERLNFFWQSRPWVESALESLNDSLEDEWVDVAHLRPFFPEISDSNEAFSLAA